MGEGIEGLLREVLAGQAGITAKMSSLEGWVGSVARDTKEARDGVVEMRAALNEQDMPGRITEIRNELRASLGELRSDVVHQHSTLRTELKEQEKWFLEEIKALTTRHDEVLKAAAKRHDDLADRVQALEILRTKAMGAGAVFGWLGRWGPLAVSLLAAAFAAMGFQRSSHGG